MQGGAHTSDVNPYELYELAKYFDPFIFQNLGPLTVSETSWTRLTVAFWDIAGFSEMCNQLRDDQSKITYFLKDYFNEAARIISNRKGILDKFIGDGILAYFGYPNDFNNSPSESIMAALDLKSSFQKIKQKHASIWLDYNGKKIDVYLKCGIHIGMVIFGILETDLRKQVTVIGREVNFASRLVEEIAEKDEIIVSEELKNVVRKDFRFENIKVEERKKETGTKIKSFKEVKDVFKLIGKSS
jgi:class 3 adenylate cyclase